MRICVGRNLAELQGVLIAVVRHNMHVRRAVRHLGLDGDKPAGDMPAIKHPTRRIASEHRRNLLLGGQKDEGGLKQAGPNDRRRFGIDDHDAPGRVGLDVRLGGGCSLTQGRDRGSGTGEQERGEDVLGSGRHYACSPFAKRSMPSVRPYFSTSFDRRTRSLGRVENLA